MKARLDAVARRLNQLAMLPAAAGGGGRLAWRVLRRLHRSAAHRHHATRGWLVKQTVRRGEGGR